MKNPFSVFLTLSILANTMALAAPVHVVRFFAPGRQQNCDQVIWRDNLVFLNRNATLAEVRILGISNGVPTQTTPSVIVVPPGRAVTADDAIGPAWMPDSPYNTKLWIMHLDVPEGVALESRDEMISGYPCIFPNPIPTESLGKVSLPIFRNAAPPNVPQTFMGSDVGSRPARLNVGVYNAGNGIATAHIEIRRVCDGGLTDSRDIVVPADSIIQTGNMVTGSPICTSGKSDFMRYTTVTVDQPSMVYVVALTETPIHVLPGTAPDVGMTAPLNSQY